MVIKAAVTRKSTNKNGEIFALSAGADISKFIFTIFTSTFLLEIADIDTSRGARYGTQSFENMTFSKFVGLKETVHQCNIMREQTIKKKLYFPTQMLFISYLNFIFFVSYSVSVINAKTFGNTKTLSSSTQHYWKKWNN